MADSFIGEIRIFSFQFAPRGWVFCNGQTMPLNQNQALYSLLGVSFGGNGNTNFKLPDNRGRVPIHSGSFDGIENHVGTTGGQREHLLSIYEMPAHTHFINTQSGASISSNSASGEQKTLSASSPNAIYAEYSAGSLVTLHPQTIKPQPAELPHNNMQPYLTLNFCICLWGIYPSRP